MNQVQAKVSFYHDLTGSRAQGEVFSVDSETLQALEQAGYVQEMNASGSQMASVKAEIASKQQEYGQAQAKANENASLMAHEQNLQANQLTQEMKQQAQQQSQQQAQTQSNQFQSNTSAEASQKSAARKADK